MQVFFGAQISDMWLDVLEQLAVVLAGAEVEGFLCVCVEERDGHAALLRILAVHRKVRDEVRQDGGRDEVAESLAVGLEDEVRVRHALVEMRPYPEIREQQHRMMRK